MSPICVLGGVLLDLAYRIDSSSLGSDKIGNLDASIGGVGFNVARNLTRLGNPSVFVTVLKQESPITLAITEELSKYDVDISELLLEKGVKEAVYIQIIDGDAISITSTSSPLDCMECDSVNEIINTAIKYDEIVIDTNMPRYLFERIAQLSDKKWSSISLISASDSKSSKLKWARELKIHLEFVGLNEGELELIGLTSKLNNRDISILSDLSTRIALITLGKAGAFIVDETGFHFIEPPTCKIVDPAGAGDAMFSAISYCIRRRIDPKGAAGKKLILDFVSDCLGRSGA